VESLGLLLLDGKPYFLQIQIYYDQNGDWFNSNLLKSKQTNLMDLDLSENSNEEDNKSHNSADSADINGLPQT